MVIWNLVYLQVVSTNKAYFGIIKNSYKHNYHVCTNIGFNTDLNKQ